MFRGSLYIIIFLTGALLGNFIPGYIDLYQQRLLARYEQVSLDLAPFQEIADRHHGGSLVALVQYHLASGDPTFHDEGVAIGAMLGNRSELAESLASFDAPIIDRAVHVVRNADSEMARQTWDAYRPALTMTPKVLVFSLSAGVALAVTCWLAWLLLRLCLPRVRVRGRP